MYCDSIVEGLAVGFIVAFMVVTWFVGAMEGLTDEVLDWSSDGIKVWLKVVATLGVSEGNMV